MRLIKSHRQLAVESDDDDDTSDSLSVIKKYSFHETTAAVSVLKDFTADRCLDDILHSTAPNRVVWNTVDCRLCPITCDIAYTVPTFISPAFTRGLFTII